MRRVIIESPYAGDIIRNEGLRAVVHVGFPSQRRGTICLSLALHAAWDIARRDIERAGARHSGRVRLGRSFRRHRGLHGPRCVGWHEARYRGGACCWPTSGV